MVFGNGVKNIQAAAYNGASMVVKMLKSRFIEQKLEKENRCAIIFIKDRYLKRK